jgi:hypothetical protein
MKRLIVLLVLPVLLSAAGPRSRSHRLPPAPPGPVSVIQDVAVVDVLTGTVAPHQDIIIAGDRIAEVRSTTQLVRARREIRYVIPGLWDMHVQLWDANPRLPLYIANGVTGVRDMGGDLKHVRAWQAAIDKGDLVGPRIYATGPAVSTAAAPGNSPLPVNIILTPDEARRAFNRYYDQRVDFIRIMNLSPPAFEAMAEASRHAGLALAGELPDSISAFEAAENRMVSIEHLSGIGLACSSKETELRARLLAAGRAGDPDLAAAARAAIPTTYDPSRAASLWDLLRRYDVWQTPALNLWSQDTQYEFALKLTGEMAKSRVPVLAGSYTGDPGILPGAALHNELELLVKAGLTSLEALRAATYESARMMRREASFGQIRKGYVADLVILRGDPLADIANTRKIEAVVARGKRFDRPALERMLAESAAAPSKI